MWIERRYQDFDVYECHSFSSKHTCPPIGGEVEWVVRYEWMSEERY